MVKINSKKGLAVELSKLEVFSSPNVSLEQYPTDSEIAAEVLWFAYHKGDIKEKVIADLGAGTGILGIGCMILKASKVYFVEKDKSLIPILKKNIKGTDSDTEHNIFNIDISEFDQRADVVVENPPFGIKNRHADKNFLKKAFLTAKVIYSFHKLESVDFIRAFSKDNDFSVTDFFKFEFPLKASMKFHKKKVKKIPVGCFRLEFKTFHCSGNSGNF
ncbi:methyltransferase [Candidatus Woesearchaeota archaeon]|nr:methyltransferase [Candidatus Woesearchaeota archaeon]